MPDPRILAQIDGFKDNVKDLLGEHPARSILDELGTPITAEGSTELIDSVDPANSDDAVTMDWANKPTREAYFDGSTHTFEAYQATLTPNTEIAYSKTISKPQLFEAGGYYQEDKFAYMGDPQNRETNALISKVYRNIDISFGSAVCAANVSRYTKASPDSPVNIALPSSRAIADMTYDDVDLDTLPSQILEKMQDSWLAQGEKVYCAISSKVARMLRRSRDIHSADFVNSYADLFASGKIPDIDGVTFIVPPTSYMQLFLPSGSTAVDTYFAWTPSAVAVVEYSGFKVTANQSIDHRDDIVAYLRAKKDHKRIDDNGVAVGDIVAP